MAGQRVRCSTRASSFSASSNSAQQQASGQEQLKSPPSVASAWQMASTSLSLVCDGGQLKVRQRPRMTAAPELRTRLPIHQPVSAIDGKAPNLAAVQKAPSAQQRRASEAHFVGSARPRDVNESRDRARMPFKPPRPPAQASWGLPQVPSA